MARADSQPLLLTAELALPPLCTKAGSVADWPEGSSPVAAVSGRAYQHLRQSSTSPWQSLPIQGPLVAITHHVTPALPVVEPEGASQKELDERIRRVMRDYKERLAERTKCHMGYPYNLAFDYSALEGLEKYAINNLGDAFLESNYGVHSREFEIGVLQWFARLWSIDQDEYWGYVTSCGTEGNLHGILVGRENLPDGVLLASRESHYSIWKAAKMYRMDCLKVNTLATGEMDYEHFTEQLEVLQGRPAIVNVNVGTTVKGAVDDVDRVLAALAAARYTEDRFYIHVDGALFGMMMPFIKQAPLVSFKKPIGSVSVSGHKFIGAPVPCGVVITRQKYIAALSSDVEYLNSRDATIMGSRNGHAPIYMWLTLTRKGYRGMRKDVERCLRNAHCLKAMLQEAGVKAFMNELSCTVVFERPREESFVRKWQLACEGELAHVVVMPNIGIAKLEEFTKDLIASRMRHFVQAGLKVAADARTEGSDSDVA